MSGKIIRGVENPHEFISCPFCGKQLICLSREVETLFDSQTTEFTVKEEKLEYWCDSCGIDVDIAFRHGVNSPIECGIYELDNF